MARLIAATAAALKNQEAVAPNALQREQLLEALRVLREYEAQLLKSYPMTLLEVFTQSSEAEVSASGGVTGMDSGGGLSLIADDSVQAQVDFSRTQQMAMYATDAALEELNALMSAAQGLRRVRPAANPLRPENYIRALQHAVRETRVSGDARHLWMRYMREPLGALLAEEYQHAARWLRQQGVQPAPYAPSSALSGLSGLTGLTGLGSGYATGYATGYGTGYGAVPAGAEVPKRSSRASLDDALLTSSMLRHMLAEPTDVAAIPLLPIVEQALCRFEPVVQKLAYRDPLFFQNPEHPARQLLATLTEHGRRFTSKDTPGLEHFVRTIDKAVTHLAGHSDPDAAVFASIRSALQTAWKIQAEKEYARRKARQRSALAAQIAAGIRNLADTQKIPPDILDFATGPWAEVVAQAHLGTDTAASQDDPGGYLALVPELFWSVQPTQVGRDVARLQSVLPTIHATLRQGLHSTGCTPEQITAFLVRLQQEHDRVLAIVLPLIEKTAPPSSEALHPPAVALDIDLLAPAPPLPDIPDLRPGFDVGMWVELTRQGQPQPLRTQLTWVSPNKMLFLFTATNGSTQSMTRRVCDKLLAEGALRIVARA